MRRSIVALLGLLHIAMQTQAETITHNGYTYETVVSPYTGRVWLDRNLGASRVCTAIDDEECFGDYYQWGRGTDGHEKKDSEISVTQLDISYWNNHYSYTNSSKFIAPDGSNGTYDWANYNYYGDKARLWFWSTTDGQGICPSGFRVPTKSELQAETIHHVESTLNGGAVYSVVENSTTAFNDFLKIPAAGKRNEKGNLIGVGQVTYLYTNSVLTLRGERAWYYYAGPSNSVVDYYWNYKAVALPVRCISDSGALPLANAGEDKTIYSDQNITLSASKSSDFDGEIVSYEWFENDSFISSDKNVTLTNLDIGTHIYTLRVTDNDGLSSEDNVTITVNEAPTLWLTNGLKQNYNVIANEKFYREFEIYANEYYTKNADYPNFTYSTDNLQIYTNIETLKVECEDWSILVKPLLKCKLSGNIDDSSEVVLTLYDKKYNKTNSIHFDINITSQRIDNINDQESSLVITNGVVSHYPVVSFDIFGDNTSEPLCSYIDSNGNEHPLNVRKLSDIRYQCDSLGLIDATIVQNNLNNSNFAIKISSNNSYKIVPVETFIRDEKQANAILQYACEYKYMRETNFLTYATINDINFFMENDNDCNTTMIYLGGDLTDSSRNKDIVQLHNGIWKLYVDKHVFLINVDGSSLSFEVDGGDLLENEQLLKFNTKPENKYVMTIKRAANKIYTALKETPSMWSNDVEEGFYFTNEDHEAAVRGTTFQIIKDSNKSIKYNVIEGIVDISFNETDKNITLTDMASLDVGTKQVETITKNILTPIEVQFFKDTKLNDIDVDKNIGSVSIKTDVNDSQYLLLGLNTIYGSGNETIFDKVAEGNYTIRCFNKLWYKKPKDINITIDKNHLEYNISLNYQKIADIYLDNVLQNQTIELNQTDFNLKLFQLENEQIVEQIKNNDINTSLSFDTLNTIVKVDSNLGTITTDLNLSKKITVTIMQDGKIKLSTNGLILPKSLPAGTQSEVKEHSIKFVVPLDKPIKF